MKPNKKLAKRLRSVGLGAVVDSKVLRTALGLPIREGKGGAEALAPNRSAANAQAAQRPAPSTAGPLVSVIVPSYNVEEYLRAAVNSVTSQTHANIEVILVNDGSSDGTGAIADELAAADSRVRVVHKANAGLGAARNTGLDVATGVYVTFMDSDDEIPDDAIASMVASLETSGSDFVAGSMERFNSTRVWVPEWAQEVHAEDRYGITAADFPPVLWDVFACNKLFRRTSWDRFVGKFPEGVLYEDQEGTARLYVEGARFDLLKKIVYRWRLRDDGTSITQDKLSTTNLEQRLGVARSVQRVIEASSDRALVDYWYTKLLGDDLYWYYREVPRVGEDFWKVLADGAQEFAASASAEAFDAIALHRRILAHLVVQGDRGPMVQALMHFQEHGAHWVTTFDEQQRASAFIPELDDVMSSLAPNALSVDPAQFPFQVALSRIEHLADGGISFVGYAQVLHLAASVSRALRVSLVHRAGEARDDLPQNEPVGAQDADVEFVLDVMRVPSVDADVRARDPYASYSESGFAAIIPASAVDEIAKMQSDGDPLQLQLSVALADHGLQWQSVEFPLSVQSTVGHSQSGAITAAGNRVLSEPCNGGLGISVESPRFLLRDIRVEEQAVTLRISGPKNAGEQLRLRVLRGTQPFIECELQPILKGVWLARLVLPKLAPITPDNVTRYSMHVIGADGEAYDLAADQLAERQYVAETYGFGVTARGNLSLERYAQFASVRAVTLSNDGRSLTLQGTYAFDHAQVRHGLPFVGLKGGNRTIFPSRTTADATSGEYTVEIPLTMQDVDGREVFVDAGNYTVELFLPSGHRLPARAQLLGEAALLAGLPVELSAPGTRVEVRVRGKGGALSIVLATPFLSDERGSQAQRSVRTQVALLRTPSVREAVLFESFGGRGIADSPKALDLELQRTRPGLERYWTVRDHSVAVPEGATPLIQYSRAWYEMLGSARYLVNNNNFPSFFRKHPEQVYVQAWHGTPLKRIGNDVPAANLSLSYRALMKREAEQYWDYLLAQTPWAGEVLSSAFAYDGPLLNQGYPRNDALFGVNAVSRRAQVREFFGLSEFQRVVLYAPTWRDNLKAPGGGYLQPTYLDLERVHKAFGREVIVLQRGHVNTAASHKVVTGPNVIDVSKYPDINDLYLAADLLITDYSSVQFDFVNTGRPVLYLAPDLEMYRDIVRGFYFDFEAMAPGPILRTTDEVLQALKDLEGVQRQYEAVYSMYVARFAGLDDGLAASRVAQTVFSG